MYRIDGLFHVGGHSDVPSHFAVALVAMCPLLASQTAPQLAQPAPQVGQPA